MTFLLATFSRFHQRFGNQNKIRGFLNTIYVPYIIIAKFAIAIDANSIP
jgi:hypothetical protein